MPPSTVHVFPDVSRLLHSTAGFLVDRIGSAVSHGERCSIALSGGNTPRALYQLLASDRYRSQVRWNLLRFFFGDERSVPHDHPDSNFRMARESLLDPAGVDMKNVWPVNTALSPREAAAEYEKTIRVQLGAGGSFDIILLGLGNDAHTASLFPRTDVLEERSAWVKEVHVRSLDAWRITFTIPLINAAKTVVFLAHGPSKAAAVQHVLEGSHDPVSYPARFVAPVAGEVHWFLDRQAYEK